MSRATRRVAWGAGAAALLGVAGMAHAVEPVAPPAGPPPVSLTAPAPPLARPVRLQYAAHPECPDAAGFFAHVRARTQRVRLASPDEPAEVAIIDITRTPSGSVGTLERPPLDGHPGTRRVEAGTCQEVVLALSLVLALAYDPDAITTFPTTVTAPPGAPIVVAPAPPYPPPEPPLAPSLAEPPEPRFGAAAGVSFLGTSGIAPSVRPIIGPFIEYGSTSKRPLHMRGMVSLYVEVPDATVNVAGGRQATLRFFGGQIAGCPLWVEIVPDVTFAPCLAFDLGQVIGSGAHGVQNALTDGLTWAAFELIARLRANIGGPLFAEVVGSGGLTLNHQRFTLEGVDPVYKIPTGFGSFGLGLGVHFP